MSEHLQLETKTGKVKGTSSRVGTAPKPIDFSNVFVIGLDGSGGGSGITDSGVLPLVISQSYIDVVFLTDQGADWKLMSCEIVNTVDVAPLNIWPGIITIRATTGFRVQLNGLPDSANYELRWAVSGVEVPVTPATAYTLSGPTSGGFGVASTPFTVTLGGTVASPVTVTPHDASAGGIFTPTSVTLTTAAPSATFTYTPALPYVPPTGLVDGDLVTTWPDFSGNGNNFTATGSSRPTLKTNIINGLPVVRFTSAGLSKMLLTTPITSDPPYTMMVVIKPATPTSAIYTLTTDTPSGADNLGICELGASDLLYYSCNGRLGYQTPNPHDGGFHVIEGAITASAQGVYVDGVSQTTAGGANTAPDDFAVLGYRRSDGTYSNGDIAEILFFNNVVAGADLVNTRNYLLNKWFGTPDSFDPSTVAGLIGWWKADSLLDPLFNKIDTTVSGDNVRIMVPLSPVTGAACVFCHGLGGSEDNINDGGLNEVFTIPAVNAGYLVAACNAFGYNWDNPTAQAAVEALIAYLVANYGITDVVMIGGSAGSPVGLLLATQGTTGVTMRGWHGIYPVVDLAAAHANAALTASINTAFPGYPTGTTGRDPALFAGSDFNGLRLLCCQSAADTVTPKALHGDALVALATGHAIEVACTATTGDHGDASNFTPALAADFVAFLGRCF